MANYQTDWLFDFQDVNGDVATMKASGWVADTETLATMATAAGAVEAAVATPGVVSNARLIRSGARVHLLRAQGPGAASNPPLDAWYPNVIHKARLTFANSNGVSARVSIPAPIQALFAAAPGSDVVNPSQTALAGLITALKSYLKDVSGNALNLYVGGTYRTGRPRVRKVA
jgi:hypothetical protein